METSAKDATNVQVAFERLIKSIYDNTTIDAIDEMKDNKGVTKGTKIAKKGNPKGMKLTTEQSQGVKKKGCC